MFKNRDQAGRLLAQRLRKFERSAAIVMALPRGGIVTGYAVSRELGLPLELVLAKKIGHPSNPEYGIGAASLEDFFVAPDAGIAPEESRYLAAAVQQRLKVMKEMYYGHRTPLDIKGKTVIVVDDGIATGNTLIAALKLLARQSPARIVIAAPVAPGSSIRKLRELAHEVIVLVIPLEFHGVGDYYEDFSQVNDAEVVAYLNKARRDFNHDFHQQPIL